MVACRTVARGRLHLFHSAAADEACYWMKAECYRGSPTLTWLALADFLDRGELDRHLRRTRAVYRSRRDALGGALLAQFGVLPIQGVIEGLHHVIEGDLGRGGRRGGSAGRSVRVYGARAYRVGSHRPRRTPAPNGPMRSNPVADPSLFR